MLGVPIPHPTYFLAFEILAVIAFAIILARELWQKNYGHVWEVVACAVFGMILEVGDSSFGHSYSYSHEFIMQIAGVPIAIGLGWAAIIYCAMLLSDQYRVHWTYRPFMDALTALSLDISMDIIAIRMGFWTWTIPLNQQWYGVPYSNLAGWIFVTLSFSFIVRYIRTLDYERFFTKVLMTMTPFLAFIGLIVQLMLFSIIAFIPYGIDNWSTLTGSHPRNSEHLISPEVTQWELIILVALVVQLVNLSIFVIATNRKTPIPRLDIISFGMLSGIHLFFLFALFQTGIYRAVPIAAVIGFVAFAAHCLVHFMPWILSANKEVYVFKAIRATALEKGEQLQANISAAFK